LGLLSFLQVAAIIDFFFRLIVFPAYPASRIFCMD